MLTQQLKLVLRKSSLLRNLMMAMALVLTVSSSIYKVDQRRPGPHLQHSLVQCLWKCD